ncbi:hypothetical protein [Fibrella arboris]|uniref:hypothetical protein n=1 Tax=Fibrella arboris TaxID=3242486 RepID=UPI0035205D4D
MNTTYLRVDPDDLDDVLTKIEQSYSITFGTNDLRQVETFGQLCEAITEKIQLADLEDCTSQQAFYKLRQGIVDVLNVDRQSIRPATELAELFPRSTRRTAIQQLERHLGFNPKLLVPNSSLASLGVCFFFASPFVAQYGAMYGVASLVCAVGLLVVAIKSARQFSVQTVGELAEKLAREHYTKMRRDSCTVNKQEIAEQIKQLFYDGLAIKPDSLHADSLLNRL